MFTKRRVLGAGAGVAATVLALVAGWPAGAQESATAPDQGLYTVEGADSAASRTEVASSGVDVLGVRDGAMEVVASPVQASALRDRGLTVSLAGDWRQLLAERSGGPSARAADFPAGDEGYHTYDEMVAALRSAGSAHPDITSIGSLGRSYEGRDLPMIKISDHAATDEDEPEVLFTCNMHAREHLTTEMCLHIVDRFTSGYGSDATVTRFVDSREIYVVPSVNPDGSVFDISGGEYQGWRKNRQPNSDGTVGVDINRNFSYLWGCCGGSSSSTSAEDYRGPSAASSPEVRAVQAFADSRVIGGVQQLKGHIDFHTFSELVLWPFGHTHDTVTEGMTQQEYDRFRSIGQQMAAANGYAPDQSSGLYVTDGDINDYMWGTHKVLSYCFEMYPKDGGIDGFYPPDEDIVPQTTRNDGAVDILLTNAT